MEVKHLRLVAAIVDAGSLTRAADKLFLTQSALSHQLREIETELGTKVFERINKKLLLTAAGSIVLRSARVVLGEIEKAQKEISQQQHGELGEIRLSTQCYTCYHWLPGIIKSFHSAYPNVEVSINTDFQRGPLAALLGGKLDVAIVYEKRQDKNLRFTNLFVDELVALVPASHPLSVRKFLRASDFTTETFVTPSATFKESRAYRDFFEPGKALPKKVTYVQLTESIVEMVKAGLGISVMPSWLLRPYTHPALTTVRLGPFGLRYQWYVATLSNDGQKKYDADFIEHLKKGIFLHA